MVALVSTNRPQRFRTQDSIDGTMIIPGASKAALHLHDQLHIVVSGAVVVVVVPVVIVRVVRIGIRIEDGKAKRVDEKDPSIMEMAEMMCARHCP